MREGRQEVHSGTGSAERHVLHMLNCLAAGILRSSPPPSPVQSRAPLSHLLALICRHRPLLEAHHQAAEWIWAESSDPPPTGRLQVPFTPTRTSTPAVSPARASSEVGRCLRGLLHNGIKTLRLPNTKNNSKPASWETRRLHFWLLKPYKFFSHMLNSRNYKKKEHMCCISDLQLLPGSRAERQAGCLLLRESVIRDGALLWH